MSLVEPRPAYWPSDTNGAMRELELDPQATEASQASLQRRTRRRVFAKPRAARRSIEVPFSSRESFAWALGIAENYLRSEIRWRADPGAGFWSEVVRPKSDTVYLFILRVGAFEDEVSGQPTPA